MKYIDADLIRKEVKRRTGYISVTHFAEELLSVIDSLQQKQPMPSCKSCGFYENNCPFIRDTFKPYPNRVCEDYTRSVMSEQEQPEDVVSAANVLLEALSKTPYNNKPITDAQIIVKQLLVFFENPKEYAPDAILEPPEVDLEKEIKNERSILLDSFGPMNGEQSLAISNLARHFYKLGLNSKKEV